MRNYGFVYALAFFVVASSYSAFAQSDEPAMITIAAYEFPPYYSSRADQHILGVIVQSLNESQNNYRFEIQEIRPTNRYSALLSKGCCDLMLFESLSWGWNANPEVLGGPVLSRGTERLYAKSSRVESGEVEFTVDGTKKVGGVLGYHYRFAGFSTVREVLELDFNVYSSDSQASLLNMLANERLDLALLTDEYVNWLQLRQNRNVALLFPNPEIDHSYTTQIIFNPRMARQQDNILRLFDELHEAGRLPMIFNDFGLESSYIFQSQP